MIVKTIERLISFLVRPITYDILARLERSVGKDIGCIRLKSVVSYDRLSSGNVYPPAFRA